MKITTTAVAAAIAALFALPAAAQSSADLVERNARQQERIEQGLRSGDLTVQEASRLEREAARVERIQSRALADGRMTPEEARRIDRAQDHLSRDIHRERHDAQVGDPSSPSARRMAESIDRNGNQQHRIAEGLRSGQLTNHEAARLERGQAHMSRLEGRAGADGHYGRYESRRIQQAENHQSRQIWREKHDGQVAGHGYARREAPAHGGWQGEVRRGGGHGGERIARR